VFLYRLPQVATVKASAFIPGRCGRGGEVNEDRKAPRLFQPVKKRLPCFHRGAINKTLTIIKCLF
jgi:hypothetical protein